MTRLARDEARASLYGDALTLRDQLQSVIEQLDRADVVDRMPRRDTLRDWLRQLDELERLAEYLADGLAIPFDDEDE